MATFESMVDVLWCLCRRSAEQVERDFGPTPTDDAKGGA